ncbi:MAG: YlxR family protein [Dehalococcoidia bacterium]
MPAAKGPRPRHVPRRTCVACREGSFKRELVRIVRTPEGRVLVDETGKRPGRGAYLCRCSKCWQAAVGGKRDPLSHALKTTLADADREALRTFAEALPDDTPEEGLEN